MIEGGRKEKKLILLDHFSIVYEPKKRQRMVAVAVWKKQATQDVMSALKLSDLIEIGDDKPSTEANEICILNLCTNDYSSVHKN